VRRPSRDSDKLDQRLRANRPEPRSEFLELAAGRIQHRGPWSTFRVAFAAALTAVGVVIFGAFGGIGYASSAAHSFVKAVTSNNGANASSAAHQYVGKTTICHRTHSAKNPFVVITVSNNALPAHEAHGDTLVGPGGTCPGPPIR
jgi:hypothetical protein